MLASLALAPGFAFGATVYEKGGAELELYGNIQLAYASVRAADGEGGVDTEDQILDNGSTLGVRGTNEFGNGITAYFRYEFEGDADEIKIGNGLDTGDQAYIGAKGGFGDLRVGSWDPLVDDLVQDAISNNEFFDLTDSNGIIEGDDGVNTQNDNDEGVDREGDKLQYQSPSLGGAALYVGFQYKGNAEGENVSGSGNAAPYVGINYEVGPFRLAAVWDSLDNYDGDVTGRVYVDSAGDAFDNYDAGDQYGVVGEYRLEDMGLRVALKYERYQSGDSDFIANEDRVGLGARYDYGYGDIYGAYQFVSLGDSGLAGSAAEGEGGPILPAQAGDDYNEVNGGITYNIIPDVLYTWVEAAYYDRPDDEGNGIALGAAYSF